MKRTKLYPNKLLHIHIELLLKKACCTRRELVPNIYNDVDSNFVVAIAQQYN